MINLKKKKKKKRCQRIDCEVPRYFVNQEQKEENPNFPEKTSRSCRLTTFGCCSSISLSWLWTRTRWKMFAGGTFPRTRHRLVILRGSSGQRFGRGNSLQRRKTKIMAKRSRLRSTYNNARFRAVKLLRKRSAIDAEIFQTFVILQNIFDFTIDLWFTA